MAVDYAGHPGMTLISGRWVPAGTRLIGGQWVYPNQTLVGGVVHTVAPASTPAGSRPVGTLTPTSPANQVTGPPTGTSQADLSAKATISGFLSQYGLGSLADWAWGQYTSGHPVEQIMLDIRSTPEYKARFPAMDQLAKQGEAITEQQYIDFEKTVKQINQQYGIPSGMFDTPAEVAKLLTGNVSTTEWAQRMDLVKQSTVDAPPELKQLMGQWFGAAGDQALTALYADPTKAVPLLEKQFNEAQIGAQAQITGFGGITQAQAQSLAEQGVTGAQAQSGFTALGQLGEVTSRNLAGEQALSQDQLLAAQFGGNTADQKLIQTRQQRRLADFAGGGAFTQTSGGSTGVGTAQGA